MTHKRTLLIVISVMLSLFMASVESTIVAAATPTIVSELGGLAAYSWVFAAYMLASTMTMPIFGRLSDLFGRRAIYIVAMLLFLLGSALCGAAATMPQLIAFRVIQGLGAGGLLPLAFTIVADIFSLEQRARVQGLFSAVWGTSSVIGPLLGGFLVDHLSWRWIFYVNIIPGAAAIAIAWVAWGEHAGQARAARSIDLLGTALLAAAASTLLIGLHLIEQSAGAVLLIGAAGLSVALVLVERRAASPVLPLPLLRDRTFAVACVHGLLAGAVLFGITAFVPLLVQAASAAGATVAGATLTPLMVSSVVASFTSVRLALRVPFRTLALAGMALMVAGTFSLAGTASNITPIGLMIGLIAIGVGLGLSVPVLLLAVQQIVGRHDLGSATSTVQFTRSIGGAIGVSVMGVLLSMRLAQHLADRGLGQGEQALPGLAETPMATSALEGPLRLALAAATQDILIVPALAALLGLAVVCVAPAGLLSRAREQPVAPAAR